MLHLDWNHAWTGRVAPLAHSSDPKPLKAAVARLGTEIGAGRLPFLNLPFHDALIRDLEGRSAFIKGFKHLVLLGIGGSALGARALQKAFFPAQDRPGHQGPWLWIADNVDAPTLEAWLGALPPAETLVVVVSKSGGTIETLAQYFLVREWLEQRLGAAWREHVLMVTDEHQGFLREEAARHGIGTLPVPDHLGGRYSVLSAVGLVPALFLGMDWKALLQGCLAVTRPLTGELTPEALAAHPAWRFASWGTSLANSGYSQLIFFVYMPQWAAFGNWFAQLWAESLGKGGKGTMPLPAVGVTDQHSTQQMFLDGPADKGCVLLSCPNLPEGPRFPDSVPDTWHYLRGKRFGDLLDAERLGSAAALASHKVPLLQIKATEGAEANAGALMGLCMAATLFAGWQMELNPLDQPAVELGKRLACARLGAGKYPEEAELLRQFLGTEPV